MMSSNPLHPLVPGMLFEILCDKVKHEKPLLQVVHFKLTPSTGPSVPNRIKFAISDGKHYSQAVIPPSFYEYLSENPLNIYSIIQIDEYTVQSKGDRTFIVISKCNWSSAVPHPSKLGSPTNIDSDPNYIEKHSSSVTANTTATASLKAQMNLAAPPAPISNKNTTSSMAPLSSSTITHQHDPSICDISTLSPFNNSWTIKARISNKSDVKHFNSKRTGRDGQITSNEGKLFSCTLIDNSGEIRITGFNESVDRFYDTMFEGQVYMISGGVVSVAKKSWGVKNDYEIRLEPTSTVSHCTSTSDGSSSSSIPMARYEFTSIDALSSINVPPPSQTPGVWVDNPTTDVIGVILDISPSTTIVAKTSGKTLIKRDITIGDRSKMSSKVTIWGDQADQYPSSNLNSIIAIKGCRVGEFQGMKQLSLSMGSQVAYNPDIQECHVLRGWYDSLPEAERLFTPLQPSASSSIGGGAGGDSRSTKRKTISEIRDSVDVEGTEYCDVFATVLFIKQEGTISYPSCPGDSCSKKVFPDNDPNMWRCDRCEKSFPSCLHRYLLNIQVSDPTGPTWMSAFNEAGEIIMGGNSAEKMLYLSENDPVAYKAVFEGAVNRSYVFRCKVKQEPYQGEMKQRCQIITATPADPVKESQVIIEEMGFF